MTRPPAQCGTPAGYYRHTRTLKEAACTRCRAAVAAQKNEARVNPKPKRFCSCGTQILTDNDKCGLCHAASQRVPCLTCGKPTKVRNLICSACRSDATADDSYPWGWVRERPGGPLVGVRTAHNSDANCSAHDLCDRRLKDAA